MGCQEVQVLETARLSLRLPEASVAAWLAVAGVDHCCEGRLHDEQLMTFGTGDETIEQLMHRQMSAYAIN